MMGRDNTDKPGAAKPGGPKDDRQLREAAALRENLRRRKMQQRARSDGTGPSSDSAGTGREDPDKT